MFSLPFVHLQVASITTTKATTTPTSPLASSSSSPAWSSSWEWASTTACWTERGKRRREERGRSPRRSAPPCWRLPPRQNRTRRRRRTARRPPSRWTTSPRWTRTRCRELKRDSRRTHTATHTSQKHTQEWQLQPHTIERQHSCTQPWSHKNNYIENWDLLLWREASPTVKLVKQLLAALRPLVLVVDVPSVNSRSAHTHTHTRQVDAQQTEWL